MIAIRYCGVTELDEGVLAMEQRVGAKIAQATSKKFLYTLNCRSYAVALSPPNSSHNSSAFCNNLTAAHIQHALQLNGEFSQI